MALEVYLSEIDRTPLLSAAQEQALAARIAQGDTEARDRMVRANLRLVVNIARGYTGRGLALDDLIAEGNMGLLRAVEGYDAGMSTRFSTYASFWIKQSIRRGLQIHGRTVRLPAYAADLTVHWRRAAAALQEQLGRAPTEGEVAKRLGLSPKKVRVVKEALRACSSGHADDCEGTATDAVADHRSAAPGDQMEGAEVLGVALTSLDRLDEREALVVRLRFGLGGEEPRSLQEVGDRLGCTRERVRQIEREALLKLREYVQAA